MRTIYSIDHEYWETLFFGADFSHEIVGAARVRPGDITSIVADAIGYYISKIRPTTSVREYIVSGGACTDCLRSEEYESVHIMESGKMLHENRSSTDLARVSSGRGYRTSVYLRGDRHGWYRDTDHRWGHL
jgi:hypothetical protein